MKVKPEVPSRTLGVSELARVTGSSTRSIRYYDDHGLLSSRRDANGYRQFDADAAGSVARIQSLLEAGYNLDLVSLLLPCTAQPDHIDLCPEVAGRMREVLERKRDEARRLEDQAARIARHLEAGS